MIYCVPGSSPEPRHFEKREDPEDEVGRLVHFLGAAAKQATKAEKWVKRCFARNLLKNC